MTIKIKPIPLSSAEAILHESALRAAARFRSAQSELLDLIQEVDRTRIFVKMGIKSCFSYCVEVLKLSEDMTCNFTTVARKSVDIPELKQAVHEGLSIAKARKISPVLTEENQTHWIGFANTLTFSELERELAKEFPQLRVRERVQPISDDRHKVTLGLNNDVLELFKQAQDIVSSKKGKAATLEDTLGEVMREYAKRHLPKEKASRAKKNGPTHATNARDQGRCQAEGKDGKICGQTRWLHLHHKVPRSKGGGDSAENLVTLCSFHHQLLHKGEETYPPRGG